MMTLTRINRGKHFITRHDEKIRINHVNALVVCRVLAMDVLIQCEMGQRLHLFLCPIRSTRHGSRRVQQQQRYGNRRRKNTWRLVYLGDKRKLYSGGE